MSIGQFWNELMRNESLAVESGDTRLVFHRKCHCCNEAKVDVTTPDINKFDHVDLETPISIDQVFYGILDHWGHLDACLMDALDNETIQGLMADLVRKIEDNVDTPYNRDRHMELNAMEVE
jgi:hypothetical protein